MLKLQDSNIQVIDKNKVEILVKFAEMNIQTYNPITTVSTQYTLDSKKYVVCIWLS